MARSKAKKMREKRVREGKRNPIHDRSAFAHQEMYNLMTTKKTKSRSEKLNRIKHKKRLSSTGFSEDHSRFVVYTASF
ncbi:hypothetical protein [Fictibacillus norfolkensis]|uniref:YqkK n=1 Tax=Fictibacillus norfolkensis TaxID=2762233 RepID=A0ABR8SLL5_9BACL|nr:hypothetical protein [Fictibacillus norfolkensis]MBD7964019.1 hypothetical protein [Fictibacillus norfolkensis]